MKVCVWKMGCERFVASVRFPRWKKSFFHHHSPHHVCHLRDSERNVNMVIAHQTLGSMPTPANVGEYPKQSLSGILCLYSREECFGSEELLFQTIPGSNVIFLGCDGLCWKNSQH